MKQKQPKNKQGFEMNGGYFIDGVAYMDCKITGRNTLKMSVQKHLS